MKITSPTSANFCPNCKELNAKSATQCVICKEPLSPVVDAVDETPADEWFDKNAPKVTPQTAYSSPKTPASSPRFCPDCGASIVGASRFCASCGAPIYTPTATPATSSYYPDASSTHIQGEEPSVLLKIASFFVPIIGAFLWIYYSLSEKTARQAKVIGRLTILGFLFGCALWYGYGFARYVKHIATGKTNTFTYQGQTYTSRKTSKVEYVVSGTAKKASLTFNNEQGGGEQVTSADIPWSKNYVVEDNTFLYLSAQNLDEDGGTVKVQIVVDGVTARESTASGYGASAICNGRL